MSRFLPAAFALLIATPLLAAPTAGIADGKIVVTGVGSSNRLRVVVAEGTEAEIATRPAVSGEWAAAAGKAVFTPKYPLQPGTRYRVLGAGDGLEVRIPKPDSGKPTAVTHIYPTATELPANVLRFYVEFNRPMPRGEVYKHVHIYTDEGKKVELPFLEIDDELWNADQTRITLLIDPGRIKQEVKPRIDLGPVFVRGKKYTLVVSGKWPTLDGVPLGEDVRKPISATTAVCDALDPKGWQVSPPPTDNDALRVAFGRPMDRPVMMRALTVLDAHGKAVAGRAEPADDDRGWTFTPKGGWVAGEYTLRADPVLEDVCGNRVSRPFEVDLLKSTPKDPKPAPVDIRFTAGRR
ncbi:MAG TPA: hypothetical protein VKD90_19370 [Gemmataceae bacterium]|nr:hypothetical protein [Gemmataceae bacterium]